MIQVSILILTYNRFATSKEHVPKIIDNIGDISNEVLIWDNYSTDGTYDWLEQYSQADCRVTKIFGAEKNIGVEAINYLAKEAKGKYILKVDDDVIVPKGFAKKLVNAFEYANEEKLLFLGLDMGWQEKTFATRSGMRLYKDPLGKIINFSNDRILITFNPKKWMVNGVCRLSRRDKFLDLGGHPEGIIYGVDYLISCVAERNGYWIGFLTGEELVQHHGVDSKQYRKMKDMELKRAGAPRHV